MKLIDLIIKKSKEKNNKNILFWFDNNLYNVVYNINNETKKVRCIKISHDRSDCKEFEDIFYYDLDVNIEITIWIDVNCELEIYTFYYDKLIFYDVNKNKFYYFYYSRNFETRLISKIDISLSEKLNKFYLGKMILEIKDENIILKKFIKSSYEENYQKLLYFALKNIYGEKDFPQLKQYISELNYCNNSLFNFITELNFLFNLIMELGSLEQEFIFNLNQIILIIKFNFCNSDFFNTLISLRTVRNLIFSYIYDKAFIAKKYIIKTYFDEINFSEKMLNYAKTNNQIFVDKEQKINYEKKIELNTKKLAKILKELEQFDKEKDIKEQINQILIEYDEYYKTPIYFSDKNFEQFKKEDLEQKIVDNKKIFNYINKNLLFSEKEIEDFEKSNLFTNNSVHKNNYDRVGFPHWILNNNEIDIFLNIFKTYILLMLRFINHIEKKSNKNLDLINKFIKKYYE